MRKITLLIVIVLCLFASTSFAQQSDFGKTFTYYVTKPVQYSVEGECRVNSNGHMVWGDGYLLFYNGNSVNNFTRDKGLTRCYTPRINDNDYVVFQRFYGAANPPYYVIMLYGGTFYTLDPYHFGDLEINNNYVTWAGTDQAANLQIRIFDIRNPSNFSLYFQSESYVWWTKSPFVSDNGYIAFVGKESSAEGDWEIYRFDGSQILRLTDNNYDDYFPETNEKGHVAWEGNGQIFLYDGVSEISLGSGHKPQINDKGHVVWENDGKIYLYNGITTIRLTSDSYINIDPKINNSGYVVWRRSNAPDDYAYDIIVYDGIGSYKIEMPMYGHCYQDSEVSVSNDGYLAWKGYTWIPDVTYITAFRAQIPVRTYYDSGNYKSLSLPKVDEHGFVFYEYYDTSENQVWKAMDTNGNIYEFPYTPPIVSANLNGKNQDSIIINFGPQYGIWIYDVFDGGTWSKLHTISPDSMIAAQMDGDEQNIEDLIIDFGSPYGIWIYYNNSTWTQLHDLSPESMVTADLDGNGIDDLIINFGNPYGIWTYYNNSTWSKLHDLSPKSMVKGNLHAGLKEDLIIDFGNPYGIWTYYNSTWTQLHSLSSESMVTADLDGNGIDDLIIDFGDPYGIWTYYNNSTWTKLHDLSPESMVTGNLDSDPKKDIIIDFGKDYGIWIRYNDLSWVQLHNLSPDSMVTGNLDGADGDDIVIDFGDPYGIWTYYNNSSWVKLHDLSP